MNEQQPKARTDVEIDENLRRVFRQMEESSLPDRFTDLLQQLREKDRGTGSQS
ncbi:NepR family anti-sigma factor [Jannaschia formosa]|uniref:NepR family anti-sigma factor n=1 Tax=Jannaschia formosa TaxID=2259592 RepID=UPI001432214F|nr:NepR family anti-sigma factor [Jannaschia formosa]